MSDSQLAVRPTASSQLAAFIGMEPRMMLDTIKAQCFKGSRPDQVSDAQLAAFVSIAAEMQVNPLLPGMLYAYPSAGAIVPMMGPDAVFKKLTEHKDVDSWETVVYPEDPAQPATHAVTKIYRRSSERPLTYTAILSEWKVGSNPNWNSRPRHMLALRSLKQCARQIIHGIPFDEDERQIMGEINVTPVSETPEPPKRPPAPRKAKGAATVIDVPAEAPAAPATAAEQLAGIQEPPAVTSVQAAKIEAAAGKALGEEGKPLPDAASPTAKEAHAAVADPAPAPEPPKSAVTAVPGQPRAFLSDGEEITCEATATEVAGTFIKKNGTPNPGVKAALKGGYNGDVYHLTGGTASGEDVIPNKPWAKGAKLTVTLKGELSAKTGRVIPFVQKVEGVGEAEEF